MTRLRNMTPPIDSQVIDLTLYDTDNEASSRKEPKAKQKKKKSKQSLPGQGISTPRSVQASSKALLKSNGLSPTNGRATVTVMRSVQPQQQTAVHKVSEDQQADAIETDALIASTPTEPQVEKSANRQETPQTPKAKIVSPSKQSTGTVAASFFEPSSWLDRSPATSSQKTKSPGKLRIPKQRESSAADGARSLFKNARFEFADDQEDRISQNSTSRTSAPKVVVTTEKCLDGIQNIKARSENAIAQTEQILNASVTNSRSSSSSASNPKQHLPEHTTTQTVSEIKETEQPQSSYSQDPLANTRIDKHNHDLSVDKSSTTTILQTAAVLADVEHIDNQLPLDANPPLDTNSLSARVEKTKPCMALKSMRRPQTAARPTSTTNFTDSEFKPERADMIRYLNGLGIQWSFEKAGSETFIIVKNCPGAFKNGPNGIMPGFLLWLQNEGEPSIGRRELMNSGPSHPQDYALDKLPDKIDPSSTSLDQSKDPDSIRSVEDTTASLQLALQSLLASESAISDAGPAKNHERRLKRKSGRMESNRGVSLSYRKYTLSGSESQDNSDHLVVDSAEQGFQRRSRRRRRIERSSSPVLNYPYDDGHFAASAVQAGHSHQGMSKLRMIGYPAYSRGSLLRNRDINGPTYLTTRQSFTRLRDSWLDTTIRPWKSWTGASKDIISTAWAPDGLSFVVGSSTDLDERSLQYNRSNNLLWCDMTQGIILELDKHKIEQPHLSVTYTTEEAEPDRVMDTGIYTTISDIRYSRDSNSFWTASYDKTVKLWQLTNASPRCKATIQFYEHVDILANHEPSIGLIAVGRRSCKSSINLIAEKDSGSNPPLEAYRIPKADSDQATRYDLVPTALAWGNYSAGSGELLAIGYGERGLEAAQRSRGDIVLWNAHSASRLVDLTPRFSYVYDLKWHPQEPWLAAAAPVKQTPHEGLRGTQSNIRMWEPLVSDRCIFDLDCLALDINSIVFNPLNSKHVSAACTDGTIYHYDLRQPLQILAKLEHSDPIMTLDPDQSRENQDPGVQFLSWNEAGTLLYSGSSDGKIKQWNPALNVEDAFVQDIATLDAGVSSGAFSPDFTNLLIGTNKGSAHVFSSAPVTPWVDVVGDEEAATFRYIPARKKGETDGEDDHDQAE